MSNIAKKDFTSLLKDCAKFTCTVYGILEGEGVYHILGVFDGEQVAIKFYERNRREWIYFFVHIDDMWIYHKRNWIALRNG